MSRGTSHAYWTAWLAGQANGSTLLVGITVLHREQSGKSAQNTVDSTQLSPNLEKYKKYEI
jgi:hypothetical protein